MIQEAIPHFNCYASCHAATICVEGPRVLVAYCAGPSEGHRRTAIWLSVRNHGVWAPPRLLVNGKSCSGMERACWNPVFFRCHDQIKLYFKVGSAPDSWRGYEISSADGGDTWSSPSPLPSGILGPTKNPPIRSNGWVISGSSDERLGCSIHFEVTREGHPWRRVFPSTHGSQDGCIQPAILDRGTGHLLALARSSMGYLVQTKSSDHGLTWGPVEPTPIPNPDSAVAALSINPAFHVLAYNRSINVRTPLVLATSQGGEIWLDYCDIASGKGEYSYPAMDWDGNALWIAYTANRTEIRLATTPVLS